MRIELRVRLSSQWTWERNVRRKTNWSSSRASSQRSHRLKFVWTFSSERPSCGEHTLFLKQVRLNLATPWKHGGGRGQRVPPISVQDKVHRMFFPQSTWNSLASWSTGWPFLNAQHAHVWCSTRILNEMKKTVEAENGNVCVSLQQADTWRSRWLSEMNLALQKRRRSRTRCEPATPDIGARHANRDEMWHTETDTSRKKRKTSSLPFQLFRNGKTEIPVFSTVTYVYKNNTAKQPVHMLRATWCKGDFVVLKQETGDPKARGAWYWDIFRGQNKFKLFRVENCSVRAMCERGPQLLLQNTLRLLGKALAWKSENKLENVTSCDPRVFFFENLVGIHTSLNKRIQPSCCHLFLSMQTKLESFNQLSQACSTWQCSLLSLFRAARCKNSSSLMSRVRLVLSRFTSRCFTQRAVKARSPGCHVAHVCSLCATPEGSTLAVCAHYTKL